MIQLGTLIDVDLRTAWQNEAHHFTPWLAGNLHLLSEKIGVPLAFEDREVAVGAFAADILARNTLDNSRVLIENQLERTDHAHLGQIMTYLVGLEVHTVIWIAPEFREPHLSAIRWLNEHTVNPYSFFAVRVRAIKVDDSLPAPLFEVVERPNQWDRQVQEMAPSALGEYGQLRRDFWTQYIGKYPEEAAYGQPTGATSRWHVFRDFNLVLTLFLSKDYVGLLIRGMHGANPAETAALLAPHRQQLTELTGVSTWDEKAGYFFQETIYGDTTNAASRDTLCERLHEKITVYTNALNECFGVQQ